MFRPQRESFVIQVRGQNQNINLSSSSSPKLNLSAMKLFNRFRKLLMRLMFSLPSSTATSSCMGMGMGMASKQKSCSSSCERFEPPKTSCSSYYSSHSHYTEAIADCIEFFNKSSQEGMLDGRNSVDVLV